ncbi:MAG: LptF/LptG family permease, partial [Planctomycetota bacterium]
MSRLDRYLLSQLMVAFGFFALVLISVYWINRAVILFDQLIADGQSAGVFLEFTALSLPNVIRLVLPIASFAAAVYVTNRLSSESELVVAQATGVSAFRLARPVFVFGLLLALLMALLVHLLVPQSRTRLSDREAEIQANVTSRMLNEGQFIHPTDGITFYARDMTESGELLDIFLTIVEEEGRRTTHIARRAILVRQDGSPRLLMFEGQSHTFIPETERLAVTRFETLSYDVSGLGGPGLRGRRDVREMPTSV